MFLCQRGLRLLQKVDTIFFKSYSTKALSFKKISPFGSFVFECPHVPTVIKSINPYEVPDGDEAHIELCNHSDYDNTDLLEHFDIDYCSAKSVISVSQRSTSNISKDIALNIKLPHNYNVEVNALSIVLEETEGNTLKLLSSKGDCILGKIKSDHINIKSFGDISCTNLLGNGKLVAEKNISISKIQAKYLDIEGCENIELSSVYCPQLKCYTANGKMNIGSLHGNSELKTESGPIFISSLAGNVNIKTDSGDISTTIESCNHMFAVTKQGNINIGIAESVSTFIKAEGSFIDVPGDLLVDGMKRESSTGVQYFEGKLGDAENSILLKTQYGTVSFSRRNWFSKFNMDLS